MSSPTRRSWPAVSVVLCVRNEGRHLGAALAAILDQDYEGAIEVVVAVGPSTDGTKALAERAAATDDRVRVIDNPSGRTPSGLNLAVAATAYEIVARVDGHALLPTGYLTRAVDVLESTGAANVGGMMAAQGETPFGIAVAAAMTSWLGVGGARFHRGGAPGPVDTVYLGVFRREALQAVGGYDERFSRAQDYELNHRLRTSGRVVWFDPELRVTYRPRASLRALAGQYRNYGRWRWVVTMQHPSSLRLRYLAAPAAVIASLAGVLVALTGRWWGAGVPASYLAGVGAGSLAVGRRLPMRARLWLPVVLVTMHMAWGVGFLSSVVRAPAGGRVRSGGPARPGE